MVIWWKFKMISWSFLKTYDQSVKSAELAWWFHEVSWKPMINCWNFLLVSLISNENSMEIMDVHCFQCKSNEGLWILVGWHWVFHWKTMGAHRFSMGFNRLPLETSSWAPGGPRGPPGAGEVFYLSRGRRLYCLGLSSLLSCWPVCDSHWSAAKLLWNSAPIQ